MLSKQHPPEMIYTNYGRIRYADRITVKELAEHQLFKYRRNENDKSLVRCDDFVRSAIIDSVFGFCSSKCYADYQTFPKEEKEQIRQLCKSNVYQPQNTHIVETVKNILGKYMEHEKLGVIVENYMQLFNINSGVTVVPCYDYSIEKYVGLKLIATKNWRREELLNLHNMTTIYPNAPQEMNAYSVSIICPSGKDNVWLGPCAFVNHHCKPNAQFHSDKHGDKGGYAVIEIIHPISAGQEITVSYGSNYFKKDCECSVHRKNADLEEEIENGNSEFGPILRSLKERNLEPELTKESRKIAYEIFEKMFKETPYYPETELDSKAGELEFLDDMKIVNFNEFLEVATSNLDNSNSLISKIEECDYILPGIPEHERQLNVNLSKFEAEFNKAVRTMLAYPRMDKNLTLFKLREKLDALSKEYKCFDQQYRKQKEEYKMRIEAKEELQQAKREELRKKDMEREIAFQEQDKKIFERICAELQRNSLMKLPSFVSHIDQPETICVDSPLSPETKCVDSPLSPETKCVDSPLSPETKCVDFPLLPETKCVDSPLSPLTVVEPEKLYDSCTDTSASVSPCAASPAPRLILRIPKQLYRQEKTEKNIIDCQSTDAAYRETKPRITMKIPRKMIEDQSEFRNVEPKKKRKIMPTTSQQETTLSRNTTSFEMKSTSDYEFDPTLNLHLMTDKISGKKEDEPEYNINQYYNRYINEVNSVF